MPAQEIVVMIVPGEASGPARERILMAAAALTLEIGPARLTLQRVAKLASVSKGGLLYHFPSKHALLIGLAEHHIRGVKDAIDAAHRNLRDSVDSARLKARVLGMAGPSPASTASYATLLAAMAKDPQCVDIVGGWIAHSDLELSTLRNFARAAVVTLAIDGLRMRESLRISSWSAAQREGVIQELLRIADEACESEGSTC